MINRAIRHLYTKSFSGSLYVSEDLQTDKNIQLINANLQACRIISRFSGIMTARYWREKNKGKTIVTPNHFS